MTEYKIRCENYTGDTLIVRRRGEEIEFVARTGSNDVHSVYPSPDAARTFARSILALADEVDGGEVKAEPASDSRPKMGDRVIVIEDDPYTPYLVKFGEEGHGDVGGTWYCQRVEKLADEPEPLAYWEKDLLESKPKVGDRVRILRPEDCYRPGKTGSLGLLTEIDSTSCPYRVRTDDREIVWAYEVETVSPSAVAITTPTREAYLHRAAELLGANPYSAHDLMRLADYLAGESA